MSTITVTYYPHDAGTRTFYFEKNTKDEPLTSIYSYDAGFGFAAEVQLKQGGLCCFDGLTDLEGRHGTRPLCSDGSAHLEDTSRLVLVIRGRANSNYTGHLSTRFALLVG